MEDIDQRLTELEHLLAAAPQSCQLDLKKMLIAVYQKRKELSIEGIECRKRDRPTLTYTELLKEFNDLADNFEKFAMLAALTHS